MTSNVMGLVTQYNSQGGSLLIHVAIWKLSLIKYSDSEKNDGRKKNRKR
jgi:hypothetical protein